MKAVKLRGLRYAWAPRGGAPGFALRLEQWEVEAGARVAVVGPSGCGKSTLLDLIAGVLPAQAGELVVCGEPLHALGERARRAFRAEHIGFVLQGAPLVGSLDVLENVLLTYRLSRALRLDAAARERARALLEALDLGDKARARPQSLSTGERQRVALARAVVTQPALLLADEPASGLDPERAEAVMQRLEGLVAERGSALILVTHDPARAARMQTSLDARGLRA
ncbi:MAG: ATP-binding cassette domain-containing protein [Alphaproteobacteria bacterium]|nr:ATP-binding cassette domain-containing protein [Alphaproteobacteria bacterium]